MRAEILDAHNREKAGEVFPKYIFVATHKQWEELLFELSSMERQMAKEVGQILLSDGYTDVEVMVMKGN